MTLSAEWIARARAVPIEAEIKRRGIKLKTAGAERIGPCPKCGGTDRFAVNVAKQLFNCRGCGAKGDVINLVELLDSCDFPHAVTKLAGEEPPKANGKANGKDHEPEAKKIETAKFRYEDENGKLLFGVIRYEYQLADGSFVLVADGKRKKKFSQCRPDPERPGQFIWNIDGVRIVPYRLPELIEAIANGYFVVIAEGEAKVDLLRSWNVPATCCAMGAEKWKPEHSEYLRGADVVILPDADQPGREHRDIVGASLQGIAARVRVLELPGLGHKQDILDWAKQGGTVEQLHNLIEHQAKEWTAPKTNDQTDDQAEPSKPAFPLLAFENVQLDTQRRNYLVKGLLPSTGIAVVWGPPKCGKSFWATDLGLHIALGWKYRGRLVQQATVVYIALEGRYGIPARIEAFKQHHNVTTAPFHLMMTSLNLTKQVDALISDIQQQLGNAVPGVVFIDTLNRSLVGSESKDEDMSAYIAAAGKIEETFGCLVAIVHHCGINDSRPRGHTSLTGAVEVQIAVTKGASSEVIAKVELAKDLPEGTEIFSRLEPVNVGIDPDGEAITSLVMLPAEPGMIRTTPATLSKSQRTIQDAINEALDGRAKIITPRAGMAAIKAVKVSDVREEFDRRYVVHETDPAKAANAKRMAFKRALDRLSPSLFGAGAAEGTDWLWKIT